MNNPRVIWAALLAKVCPMDKMIDRALAERSGQEINCGETLFTPRILEYMPPRDPGVDSFCVKRIRRCPNDEVGVRTVHAVVMHDTHVTDEYTHDHGTYAKLVTRDINTMSYIDQNGTSWHCGDLSLTGISGKEIASGPTVDSGDGGETLFSQGHQSGEWPASPEFVRAARTVDSELFEVQLGAKNGDSARPYEFQISTLEPTSQISNLIHFDGGNDHLTVERVGYASTGTLTVSFMKEECTGGAFENLYSHHVESPVPRHLQRALGAYQQRGRRRHQTLDERYGGPRVCV
jgi:hypothetical protein